MVQAQIDGAVRLRQRVSATHAFTGVRTAHAEGVDAPTRTPQTYTYDILDDDGEGLIEPGILTRFSWANRVFYVKLLVGEGTPWSIYLTDGDSASGVAEDVDLRARDILLAQGAGDFYWTMPDLLLTRRACLRIVTAAVTRASPGGEIEVYFAPIRGGIASTGY